MTLPSRSCEPGLCSLDRSVGRFAFRRSAGRRHFPTVEPQGGRARVEAVRAYDVLFPVHEHINQPMAHFSRCAQSTGMVAIAPNRSVPPQHTIHGTRRPDAHPGESTRQRTLVAIFHHKVHVVTLHREVNDSKPCARRSGEGLPYAGEHHLTAQAREPVGRPQGDVNRMAFAMLGAPTMRHSWSHGFPLAPRPGSLASPGSERQLELSCHLNTLRIHNSSAGGMPSVGNGC